VNREIGGTPSEQQRSLGQSPPGFPGRDDHLPVRMTGPGREVLSG
jgi:hypothetical protein